MRSWSFLSGLNSQPHSQCGRMAISWMLCYLWLWDVLMGHTRGHSLFSCEPIILRMCQDLPYNTTFMPNLLNHYDQQTAALAMEPFHPMVNLECSRDFRPFLCALYAPVCMEYGRVTLPCRRLCQRAYSECSKLMEMFGVSWPEDMECTRFPDCDEPYPRLVDLSLAGEPTEDTPMAVQRDYGFWCPRELKIDPDLGYSFLRAYRGVWETTWIQERCREYHIPCPYQVTQMSRPDLILFLMKYLMALVVGIPSVFWVGSKKTCFEWASFFHGRRKKEVVNESRQVLQEPDFAQSLLRDPNTPIIRKSRGTSTQGTSTHASSTQLAMMDDQRSKAGSVHSKVSSYHGSLHRSRDGRYTPCSYRGVEERLPHGSMSRLTDHSRHSSSHRLNEQSRHSSIRDLSGNPMTHITHGTSMNRVIEEDGTSA
ncbi:frizzled-3 isoform X3 [Pezoporus occidentalis]|uniref:frizzled-3 isoform X3 n=1 Tax=Pezoporus occidentalis TaxID=407982 RepID=UPI002F91B22C